MSDICREAHEIISSREKLYGPMDRSFDEVAQLAELMSGPGDTPGQRAVLILIATKLARRKHSPDNPDHARDACGYLAILAKMEARKSEPPPPSGSSVELVCRQLNEAIGGWRVSEPGAMT